MSPAQRNQRSLEVTQALRASPGLNLGLLTPILVLFHSCKLILKLQPASESPGSLILIDTQTAGPHSECLDQGA